MALLQRTFRLRLSLFLLCGLASPTFWCIADDDLGTSTRQEQFNALRTRAQAQFNRPGGPGLDKLLELRGELNSFLELDDLGELTATTLQQSAGIYERIGTLLLSKSQLAEDRTDKEKIAGQARDAYSSASVPLDKAIALLRAELGSIKPNPEIADRQRRDELRKNYLQAQLIRAVVEEQLADTYFDDDDTKAKTLKSAEQHYKDIYDRYRMRLAGMYSLMYRARVLTKMKQLKDAEAALLQILELPDNPTPFSALKLKASLLLADCRLQQPKADLEEEADRIKAQLQSLPADLKGNADARLLRQKSEELQKKRER